MQQRETGRVAGGLCLIVAVLCLLVVASGCGEGGSTDASAENSAESGIPDSPPKLEVPESLPPKRLVVKDLTKGTGAEAKKGDEVSLQYYCIGWGSGDEYTNSWPYPHPPRFMLGSSSRLLRGFNLAVPGMREGGGREVLIPSNLAFYPGVLHPHLGPLGALICKVYLVGITENKP